MDKVKYKRPILNRNVFGVAVTILGVLFSFKISSEEFYSVTGVEYLSEIKKNGYEIQLLQITDETQTSVFQSGRVIDHCRFNSSTELVLSVKNSESSRISCRLTVFTKKDKLRLGWIVEKMQWRGDHHSTNFIVDPAGSSAPYFSLQIDFDRHDTTAVRERKIRLLVVRLVGPPGRSWKEALGI